ncbi:MAG: hypothetical protein K2P86_12335 [Xanthobacteraceae bacterium]|nr:hypothetical protein [Xanthobacteraceae bacterium]
MNPNEMPRTMFVTTNVLADVERFDETLQGERLAKLRAWLDGFIEGDIISVSEDPDDKQADTMLCRVHDVKDEFWSIRVTEPSRTPGIRSIGAFTDRDEFLSINWNFREGMDFDEEVADAQQIWKDFFGEEMPHFGDCLDEYLTNFKT